jgi:DNA-binding CsgD family transcriptional regulator
VRAASFVGRARELEHLEELAGDVADTGRGRLAVLAGDAGVGKTRLVQELAVRSAGAGWVVAVGGCVDLGGGGFTHGPLIEILRRLDSQLGTAEMDRLAGEGAEELAQFLPGRHGGGEVAAGRLLEQILGFIARLGEEAPALLVFEDLHWSDSSTRDLLAFLARNVHAARVLLVVTYRADDLHRRHPLRPWLAEVERGDVVALRLSGLDRRSVAQLAADVSGRLLATAEIASLTERTDGNPFYVEELLAADDGGLPGGLRDLLLSRLHALGDDSLAVLRPAAVLGRYVHEELLAAVCGRPSEEVDEALQAAVGSQVLQVEGGSCRFRHDLVREALYDDILPRQRHRLHQAAAENIEAGTAVIEPEGARWALLAYHRRSAGDRELALPASVEAARWAASVGASSEAADQFENALQLWEEVALTQRPKGMDRAGLLLDAAAMRFASGQTGRARVLAEAAVEDLSAGDDVERLALAHVRLGTYLRVEGQTTVATEATKHGLELLADRPPTDAKAEVVARFAQHSMLLQHTTEALGAADEAIAVARAVGLSRLEGHALCTKGVVLADVGRLDESLDAFDQAEAIARTVGAADDLARVCQNRTWVQVFAGLAEDALAGADAGLQIVRAQGTMLSNGIGIIENQADAAVRIGRWDDALAIVDAFPLDTSEGSTLCSLAAPRFDVSLRRGNLAAAENALAPAIERAMTMSDPQFGGQVRIRAAQLDLARGDLEQARRWVGEALAICDAAGERTYTARSCAVGMAVEARTGNTAAAGALLVRLDAIEAGGPLLAESAAFVAMARAEYAEMDGNPYPDHWEQAVAAWERCGDVYWAAVARHRQADAILRTHGDRADAAAAASRALDAARRLGAAPLVAELELLQHRGRLSENTARLPTVGLTPREAEVLSLIAEGKTNRQIGDALYISEKTASVHVTNLFRKLGVDNRGAAAEIARRFPPRAGGETANTAGQ